KKRRLEAGAGPRDREEPTGDGILMRSAWLWCALAACWLVSFAGCGSSRTALVYLASQGTNPGTITTYTLNLSHGTLNSSNGALTQTGKSVNTGTQPGVLIFDPTNSFAFVADFGTPLLTGTDNSKKNG